MKKAILYLFCCLAVLQLARAADSYPQTPVPSATAPVDFIRDIEPILKQNCYSCHGTGKKSGQLHLDSRVAVLEGGISGKAIVPGNSKQSLLIARLLGQKDMPRMPLASEPLTKQQIALIAAWIDQGAKGSDEAGDSTSKIERHWAYVKPIPPRLPSVRNNSWVRNPIDAFVLSRLEKEGLAPSPEASRETLIRRLSLDLIGLPASLEEIDSFVADKSPSAYEKVVDRLLASPHYGERWARPWLDLARYADTNGYEKDRRRTAWKYRDWVINALNKDMPFDQFTIEQVAGDMLPGATEDQKIASGFHRNTMFNEEGGVDQQEALWETNIDRVNTTATVWLGSTLGCAQCHNHKYDPFSQKEYYQLFAFFNNTDYRLEGDAVVSEQKLVETQLELPTPEQAAKKREINAEIASLEESLKGPHPELESGQSNWEREVLDASVNWTTLDPGSLSSAGGATLTRLADKSVLAGGTNAGKEIYKAEAVTQLTGITGLRIEVLPDSSLPHGGPGRDADGNFFITGLEVEVAPADGSAPAAPIVFTTAGADDSIRGGAYDVKNLLRPKPGPFGWAIDATKEPVRLARQAVLIPKSPFGFDRGTTIRVLLKHELDTSPRSIGRFRLSVTTEKNPIGVVNISSQTRPMLAIPVEKRTAEQKEALSAFYRSISPALKLIKDRIAELKRSGDRLGTLSALVMQERDLAERPSTYLRVRGTYTNKGERVFSGVPAALHPFPESQLPTRLGLARWLVDENNPLVARVTVNRFWEQFFGRGIVETSEDFGTQGDRPSHPELLDWLATEFMRQGWSMKSIHRLIITSATYRQSSRVTPSLQERDPYNRLLARGPRFRIEAEMIRDVILAASGQLSRKIGGPSVFPPQPEGVWNIPYNDDRWVESQGEDRYRRGLYTFVRRTSPYPSLVTFDAPSREFCTVRRVRTNTPLQSLTLLNDPAFFDAAKALARRIVAEGGSGIEGRVTHGVRLCVGRRPQSNEIARLVVLYERELERFKGDASAAAKIAGEAPAQTDRAELAAWTMVSNVLLNLDETLTKE
ncbi:MAG TPA: PSD1 and planctomycete cytochrome C domain-containing protein [Blastocatellia bacterium]|nr:PSD1 and planctomycete cytochrome C domain-containing protein [Blastocatellia bacterium]